MRSMTLLLTVLMAHAVFYLVFIYCFIPLIVINKFIIAWFFLRFTLCISCGVLPLMLSQSMLNTCTVHTYILFAGREVRIEKNCARGLEYGPRPQAEGRAQDRGHSFSQYGPTKAGK